MNTIVVDDEYHARERLRKAIGQAVPSSEPACFGTTEQALAYAAAHRVDVAFLDIRIDELNGLQLARKLKELNGDTNIVFVTGYDEYMRDAFRMHASGYLEKPVAAEDIAAELENLRHTVAPGVTGVRIQTFGTFEVFVNGKPVHFGRSKAKELLAYLVDRKGAGVCRKELAAILWEDEPYTRQRQKQLQTLIDEMKRALREAGAREIVFQEKGRLYLDREKVDCDYYRFERWDAQAVNAFRGEYMADYSWAEFTAGALSQKAFPTPL